MPKMKTHSGTKKRFKITGNGNVKRWRPGKSHLAPGKTQKRIRHLRKSGVVCKQDMNHIKQMIDNIR